MGHSAPLRIVYVPLVSTVDGYNNRTGSPCSLDFYKQKPPFPKRSKTYRSFPAVRKYRWNGSNRNGFPNHGGLTFSECVGSYWVLRGSSIAVQCTAMMLCRWRCDHVTNAHSPETIHWFRRQPLEEMTTVPCSVLCCFGIPFSETRRV